VVLVLELKLDTSRACLSSSMGIPINKLKLVDLPSCLHLGWPINNNRSNRSILSKGRINSLPSLDMVVVNRAKRILSRTEEEEWIKCRISFNR
jgi:hypothetical protein